MGYNSLGFFAPTARYYGPKGVDSFRDMVRAFHDAGVEVILDVVYSHTAEGNELGPTLSFKGDRQLFLLPHDAQAASLLHQRHRNWKHTVNTPPHPRVLQLITDSLRYWAEEMHVDGFRFDLGTILGREPEGFDQQADFLTRSGRTRSVSIEAYRGAVGHRSRGYQVGGFPPGWAEME